MKDYLKGKEDKTNHRANLFYVQINGDCVNCREYKRSLQAL